MRKLLVIVLCIALAACVGPQKLHSKNGEPVIAPSGWVQYCYEEEKPRVCSGEQK